MADDDTNTTPEYDYTDLPLHGRFTEDGSQFRLYTQLNGVEFPVEYYNVHDHREALDAAHQAGQDTGTKSEKSG